VPELSAVSRAAVSVFSCVAASFDFGVAAGDAAANRPVIDTTPPVFDAAITDALTTPPTTITATTAAPKRSLLVFDIHVPPEVGWIRS
jgi:hypothetical protein